MSQKKFVTMWTKKYAMMLSQSGKRNVPLPIKNPNNTVNGKRLNTVNGKLKKFANG